MLLTFVLPSASDSWAFGGMLRNRVRWMMMLPCANRYPSSMSSRENLWPSVEKFHVQKFGPIPIVDVL